MSVTVDVAVSPTAFHLGQLLEGARNVHVEFDTVVPRGTAETMPLLFVEGDFEEFERRVGGADAVDKLALLDQTDRRRRYRVKWPPSVEGFLGAVVAADAIIVDGQKCDEEWSVRLQFHKQEDVDSFTAYCRDNDVGVTPVRTFTDATRETLDVVLTTEQSETLRLAFQRGYFAVPRGVTLEELAAETGVSDQAVSERLRRGLHAMLERQFT